MLDNKALLNKFHQIEVFSRNKKRAPHKPLVLLYALAKLKNENKEQISFEEAEENIEPLIETYRPWSKSKTSVAYPFGRLINNKNTIWTLSEEKGVYDKGGDISKTKARSIGLTGGFTKDVIEKFKESPELLDNAASIILNEHFPHTLHEEILDSLGFRLGEELSIEAQKKKKKRNPNFRYEVLNAYFEQCCVCEYDLKLGGNTVGLDAAHIMWHAHNGPDTVNNGLSLCVLHHRLFDFGAFTIGDKLKIKVSESVVGGWGRKMTDEYDGKSILEPRNEDALPDIQFLEWHHEQVFKGDI